MRQCAGVGDAAAALVDVANPQLLTDVAVAAILAEAACAAARVNVEVNLKFLRDEALRQQTTAEMDELSSAAGRARDVVSRKVADHLSD